MKERNVIRLLSFGSGILVLVLIAALLWPASALACACCAEPGTWMERTDRISDYELSELNRLRFDASVTTFMTEAGEDTIQGISNPTESYTLTLSKQQRRWELRFKDKRGRTGVLTLSVPATITEFSADIHDGQESSGGGPLLYKEWRLTGTLNGTGIFKKGSTPQTKFRLVLQGRGNGCTDAEVFNNWTLQVFGPRASYSFYGKFTDPAPAKG